MKVLMVNTPDSQRFQGGDLTLMRQTGRALGRLGVEVSESFESEPDAAGCDLAHVFNLRTVHATPGQVGALKRAGVPVVLSPLYLDPSVPLWATRVVPCLFAGGRTGPELDRLLADFAARTLRVEHPGGDVWSADSRNRPRPDYDAVQRETLAHVDHLLPGSYLEMGQLVATLRVCGRPFTVVPYAADPAFLDADPGPFAAKYGVRDFVLQVGRIEAAKNQLLLAYALRDLGLPLVLIGTPLQPGYLDWCRRYGPRDMLVLPHVPAGELASAYAAARVHALPSWGENCGLVSLEAALAGCSLVVSTAGFELEHFRDLADYCDPADVGSIRSAVASAYANHVRTAPRRERLRRLILGEYTWERAAELTYQAYRRVLGDPAAGCDGVSETGCPVGAPS